MGSLLIARHAEATAPHDTRLPGPDLVLTRRGRRQAGLLAQRLAVLAPEAVYCGDARRARQTAEIVAAECGVAVTAFGELRELDFGGWAGRTYREVIADDPTAIAYFGDPTTRTPPGGEHVEAAATRVLDALGRVHAAHPAGAAVVVGHTGSMRLAFALALGMPLSAYWRLRLDHAGLSVCDWSDAGLILESLNDRSHLPAAASGPSA